MRLGIECLLTDDSQQAQDLAVRLDALNHERKAIELSMQVQAERFIEAQTLDQLDLGVCLFEPDWHEGVIGIVASRIKDKIYRPVIAFAQSEKGVIKGSARSIPGFHMRDALDVIAKKQPNLLSKFGGHAMAAGLSIRQQDYDEFKQVFAQFVSDYYQDTAPQAKLETDGELDAQYFDLATAQLLQHSQPWGQHFPEPTFDCQVQIISQRIVGEKHLKLVLCPKNQTDTVDAIWFNADLSRWPNQLQTAHIVFQLDINEFRQQQTLQLLIMYMQ